MKNMMPSVIPPTLTILGLVIPLVLAFAILVPRCRAASPRMTAQPEEMPLDNEELIDVCRQVENWDGFSVGRFGELGPYRFTRDAWYQHTTESHSLALCDSERARSVTRDVCRAHASWLRDIMERRRMPQTAYSFALLWGAGPRRVATGHISPAKKSYAERAQNLYVEAMMRRDRAAKRDYLR